MIQTPPTIAPLELGLQELEALEAPGFWTGFGIGVGVATAGISGAAVYTAISAIAAT